jgi:hypothetical protein
MKLCISTIGLGRLFMEIEIHHAATGVGTGIDLSQPRDRVIRGHAIDRVVGRRDATALRTFPKEDGITDLLKEDATVNAVRPCHRKRSLTAMTTTMVITMMGASERLPCSSMAFQSQPDRIRAVPSSVCAC